jgi:glyoxylase-like metal-dependent hydrolase (beta-lactamase superfamily II)
MKVKYTLKQSGYCEASEHHVLRGNKKKKIQFYATWGHIEHPEYGHILFDTGYTNRFFEETKKFPFNLYAKVTPAYLKPEEEAINQLKTKGIAPEDVSFIIISHFHADHISGLSDYPNATYVCSTEAYSEVKGKKGIAAVRRAFVPALLPPDFEQRLQFVTFNSSSISIEHLGKTADLFHDGSVLLFTCPGHAAGQMGALLQTETSRVLIAADAAWVKQNYESVHLPMQIVRIFFHSWKDFKQSLKNIHLFHKANPETPIIPCHCKETMDVYLNKTF